MLDKLKDKITQLEQQATQSAARHNALIGALTEMKALYDEVVQASPVIDKVVEVLEEVL